MKSKAKAILEIFYVKEKGNLTDRENFKAITHEPDCYKLLEITESICCFY